MDFAIARDFGVLNMPASIKILLSLSAYYLMLTANPIVAQTATNNRRNNPYSPSPTSQIREPKTVAASIKPSSEGTAFILQNSDAPTVRDRPSIARRIENNNTKVISRPLSEIYKVGIGDVLFVNLKNSTQGSSYCTVRPDGTIDFPLGGDDLVVAGQTVETVEEMIRSGITLYSDPQVEVKIREYASHKITVSGLVENPGDKSLQREAMPLYAIRSEAIVSQKATKAIIKRAPLLKLESYDLDDVSTDNVLIYPGNSIEFTSGNTLSGKVYYITGNVSSTGQKDLSAGITLYQAVIAAGGPKDDSRKATVRRKSDNALFSKTAYDLRAIKKGKVADPVLESGDVIEVRK